MNKIKQLRKRTGLSQSEFSKKYSVSLRTLQQWEQGISKPLDSFSLLLEKEIDRNYGLRNLYKPKNKEFRVCISDPFLNCNKVYPLQQKRIGKLISDLTSNNEINKIIIFGSSVTNRCNISSDVDIYVDSDNDVRLNEVYDFEYDLWTNRTVDERLYNEINESGVVVYE